MTTAGPSDRISLSRDTWYRVADEARASKVVLSFLMVLFSLAETGVARQAPTLTVPAN